MAIELKFNFNDESELRLHFHDYYNLSAKLRTEVISCVSLEIENKGFVLWEMGYSVGYTLRELNMRFHEHQVDKSLHAATEANNEKWVDSSIVVDFY